MEWKLVERMNKTLPLVRVVCPLCGVNADRIVATGRDYEYDTSAQHFSFNKCEKCDLLYLSPRPQESALGKIYPSNYYAFTGEDEGKNLVRLLRDKWELRKIQNYTKLLNSDDFSVLDVGCGTGRLLSLIREAHPNSKLQGIELDSRAVKIARGKGLIVERTTIEKYAPKKKFNLIIMQQVIEHVANPIAIMNKLKSLLVPDGVLILETPNLSGWDYKVFKKELWGGYHFPRHWVLFSRRSLRTLSEKTGFRVLAQENIASLSFWSWSIHHWLKKKKHTGMAQWVRPPNALLLSITAPLELVQLLCGLQTSNQRVVLQKK